MGLGFIAVGLGSLSGCSQPKHVKSGSAKKPNIIFVLADDLGYGDLSCYGQKTLNTPHLDRMAREGMKFTQHYAGSTVCAPSRCVLMTGMHTGHCTVRGNHRILLKDTDVTIADVLKKAGYATGCIGKWGIGHPPPADNPNQHGFDYFWGYVNMFHAHNCFPEFVICNGKEVKLRNKLASKWHDLPPDKRGGGVAVEKVDFVPELMTRQALDFIRLNQDQPFFRGPKNELTGSPWTSKNLSMPPDVDSCYCFKH
jgi:Sulfatase